MSSLIPPFVVVPLPVNANGEGPEMDPFKVSKVLWEVWDGAGQVVSQHETKLEAYTGLATAKWLYTRTQLGDYNV